VRLSRECACSISGGGRALFIGIVSYWVSLVDVQYGTRHTPPPLHVKAPNLLVHPPSKFTKGFLHVFKPHKETHTKFLKTKAPEISVISTSPTTPKERETQNIVFVSAISPVSHVHYPPRTSSSMNTAQAAMVLPAAVSRAASSATSCPDLAGLDVPPRQLVGGRLVAVGRRDEDCWIGA